MLSSRGSAGDGQRGVEGGFHGQCVGGAGEAAELDVEGLVDAAEGDQLRLPKAAHCQRAGIAADRVSGEGESGGDALPSCLIVRLFWP